MCGSCNRQPPKNNGTKNGSEDAKKRNGGAVPGSRGGRECPNTLGRKVLRFLFRRLVCYCCCSGDLPVFSLQALYCNYLGLQNPIFISQPHYPRRTPKRPSYTVLSMNELTTNRNNSPSYYARTRLDYHTVCKISYIYPPHTSRTIPAAVHSPIRQKTSTVR